MHRICIQGTRLFLFTRACQTVDFPLVSLALSWTVTAKVEKAGLLACAAMLSDFFP